MSTLPNRLPVKVDRFSELGHQVKILDVFSVDIDISVNWDIDFHYFLPLGLRIL